MEVGGGVDVILFVYFFALIVGPQVAEGPPGGQFGNQRLLSEGVLLTWLCLYL